VLERRTFMTLVAGGLLAAPLTAQAQQAGKIPRIGFLVVAQNPGVESRFPQGLRDLGYVDGRDVIIEWRDAGGDNRRLPSLAADLVRLRVDVIVAAGPEARDAAIKATPSLPIVVVGSTDPVVEGWAASFARPGGNATGFVVTMPELGTKRLELLREVIPGLSRLALLRPPSAGSEQPLLQTAASGLGITVDVIDVRQPEDLPRALNDAVRRRCQALYVPEVAMLYAHRTRIANLAAERRLPTIGLFRASAQAGFLMTYGVDLGDLLRRAAVYVDKILKGAKVGDLPIEQPTKFELVINLKTAKALGLTIPPSLLQRADEIIQ
jgi:putative ABC transport system substrate-binding protein